MTALVTIVIDGAAVAKGRPRVTRAGMAYTPAKTRRYEAHGRLAASLAMQGREPFAGPVAVTVHVELPIPRSWSRRKAAVATTGELRPTTRPDLDNYLKGALDAINSIVVADDCQVVEVTARKVYGPQPKMVITVGEAVRP